MFKLEFYILVARCSTRLRLSMISLIVWNRHWPQESWLFRMRSGCHWWLGLETPYCESAVHNAGNAATGSTPFFLNSGAHPCSPVSSDVYCNVGNQSLLREGESSGCTSKILAICCWEDAVREEKRSSVEGGRSNTVRHLGLETSYCCSCWYREGQKLNLWDHLKCF